MLYKFNKKIISIILMQTKTCLINLNRSDYLNVKRNVENISSNFRISIIYLLLDLIL